MLDARATSILDEIIGADKISSSTKIYTEEKIPKEETASKNRFLEEMKKRH